ncbi:M56 family metallopeptidase [Kordiimonas lipolytica]|uniref:M56 family metallopeptidase n=1 Tax=Kordiimonas lipolytica TaxID=1662421 RepID=A0ABV8U9Z9_9PROT|nr:M56 family metallopeptidase [Kordiimonas lipolytica]
MFDAFFDMPALTLALKFMVASTVLLGAVWLMEKTRLLNKPDLADMAWKLAVAGSFLALLPVGDWISKPITIQHEKTAALVEEFNEGRPLAGMLPMLDPAPRQDKETLITTTARNMAERESLSTKTDQLVMPATRPALEPMVTIEAATASAPNTLWNLMASMRTKDLAALMWAALAGLALVLLLGGYASAIKSLGSRLRVPAEHDANKALRAICDAAQIRTVPYLSRSSDLSSPVCLPRREICLPDWAFDDLPKSELDSLLAHEVAHMVRRDPLMLMVMQALSRLFFFQPLFRLARKRLADIAELSADEWAATHLADAKSVAAALYTCATKIHETRQIQWGLAMAGNKSMLKTRVERLIGANGQAFGKSGVAAKGAVACSLLAITLGLPSIQFADALSAEMPLPIMASTTAHPDTLPSAEEIEAEMRRTIEEARAKVAEKARVMAKEAKATGMPAPSEAQIAREMRVAIAQAEAEVKENARLLAERAELHEFEKSSHRVDGPTRLHITDANGIGNMVWSDGKREIKARWDGEFTLTHDDAAIASMEEGAMLVLRSKYGSKKHKVRIENPDGQIQLTYWKDGKKSDFDKEGEKWLADTLLILVRQVGLNAKARVTRILAAKGTGGVVKEIDQLDVDHVARMYAALLIDKADLSNRDLKKLVDRFAKMDSDYELRLALSLLLEEKELDKSVMPKVLKAARTIDSDYELRLLLTPYIDRFGTDNKTMKDLLELARSVESDYEMRLLLSAAVNDQTLSEGNLERLAELAAEEMESDYELRLLLSSFVEQLSESRGATAIALNAINSIGSDYEKRLALSSIAAYGAFDTKGWVSLIEAAASISGDYEKRLALSAIKHRLPDDKPIQEAFSAAVASISSDYERKRVATAVAPVTRVATTVQSVTTTATAIVEPNVPQSVTVVVDAPADPEKIRYDSHLSRYEDSINLIEDKNCKRNCILRHPAFDTLDRYDLLSMMERMIDGGLQARGVAVPDYQVTVTSIQLDHSLAALNSRVSSGGAFNSGRRSGPTMGAAKGVMKVTVELLDPTNGQYTTLELDTINPGSDYRAYGLNTDRYWTSDLTRLTAHMADAVANQIALHVGWQAKT